MALKWSESRHGFTRAQVGPFTLVAGYGSSAQKYTCEVSPLNGRRVGFASLEDAQQGAVAMLLEHMAAVADALKGVPKGGG